MSKYFQVSAIALSLLTMSSSHAQSTVKQSTCSGDTNINFSSAITCYREILAKQPVKYTFLHEEKLPQIKLRSYQLTSQFWSPAGAQPAKWQHNVDIFIPDNPLSQRALVVVNNGINHNIKPATSVPPTDFNTTTLAAIAHATNTIVVSINNIPNQYLMYQNDGKPRKEDDSVARSWTLFMDTPEEKLMMPLHLPMTAAVSQAMTLAQQELKHWNINNFIVSGASKRGWTTWLSAISDPRIDAIAPFVIDLLDIRASLKHMYKSYGGNWPVAFHSYYQEHIDEKIDTPAFSKLMQIEDPFQYLGTIYQSRLSIPKYIVNASGDDFYVPDNTNFYLDKLPGIKALRVVPNSDHRGILKFAEQSLITFVNRTQRSTPLPKVSVKLHSKGNSQVLVPSFSEQPKKILLWTAVNPVARDFRYACGIRYISSPLEFITTQDIEVPLDNPTTGWQASFIEATFNDDFVATTPVHILPNDQYPTEAPPSDNAACQTLPGRGFGTDKVVPST